MSDGDGVFNVFRTSSEVHLTTTGGHRIRFDSGYEDPYGNITSEDGNNIVIRRAGSYKFEFQGLRLKKGRATGVMLSVRMKGACKEREDVCSALMPNLTIERQHSITSYIKENSKVYIRMAPAGGSGNMVLAKGATLTIIKI